jgi:hypothetical protein
MAHFWPISSRRNTTPLAEYASALLKIFKSAPDKREAHRRSRAVLLDMAGDRRCLRAAIAAQIQRPGGLNTRHFPSIGFPIAHNPHFSLVANSFQPLPSRETDITTNSIHHHGHLLLTTVTTFGPGYEHWRFTTPKPTDLTRETFRMDLIDREAHGPNHTAFVDTFMPHAVMFPRSLTVTFALWSSVHMVTWRDHIKRIPAIERQRERLRTMAARLGVAGTLRLNPQDYFDYYPIQGEFKGMCKRIQFGRGPNEDYLHTLFYILQETNNEDLAPDAQLCARVPVENPRLVEQLSSDLRRGVRFEGRFSEGLHWLDHMNFKRRSIEQALEGCRATVLQAHA